MHAAHRVAKNTGILYARMAITVIISLYSTKLILQALGASDFGLFDLVGGIISMLGFLNASMAAATQRFISFAQGEGDIEKIKRIFNMSSLLHLGIALLVFFILELVGYFFFNGVLNIAPDRIDAAKIIFQFMVISTLFNVISVPYDAIITSHENMIVYAVLGVLEAVLKLTIALYITYNSHDHLIAYGLLMTLLSIFLLLLRRIYCLRKYAECTLDIKLYYDKPLLKEIGGFAGWSLLGSFSSMASNYGIATVLNIYFGTVINAANAITGQLTGQLSVFANTMLKAINPRIDKSEGEGNRQAMLKTTMMGCKLSFFLMSFFFIPAIIEMPLILKLWIKKIPNYTAIFCVLVLLRNQIDQLYIPLQSSISAVGNIKKYQIASSIINFLPILVSIFLFYLKYESYYLFIVFILFSLFNCLITIYFTKINCKLPVHEFIQNVIFRASFSFIIIFFLTFISSVFVENSYLKLLTTLVTSSIFSIIVIRFIGFNKEEKEKMNEVYKHFYATIKLIKLK